MSDQINKGGSNQELKSRSMVNNSMSDEKSDEISCSRAGNNKYSWGRWTKIEHRRFIEALKLYGKDWSKVQQHVGTRSSTQARSHAQKFFQRIQKQSLGQEENIINELRENEDIMPQYLIEYDYDEDSIEDSENQAMQEQKNEENKEEQQSSQPPLDFDIEK